MRKITTDSSKKTYTALTFLLLIILPWIVYCNTLTNDFVFDDLPLILGDGTPPALKTISNNIKVSTGEYGYRPVRLLSYAIDYYLTGLNPLSYHISNITYHTINTLLVYFITLFLLSNRVTAFFTALLFAVLPVHTDSVTYLAGRRDILFTLFYLFGLYTFLKYRQTKRFTFLLSSIAAYLLSIGSKEMGVTLPVLFLIYDLVNNLPEEVKDFRLHPAKEIAKTVKRIWVEHKYFYCTFLIGALTFSYYKIFINSPSHQAGYYGNSILVTFLTVSKIIIHYIKLLLFPVNLIADYSYDAFPLASSLFEWSVLSSLILLLLILYILLRILTRKKWIAFGGIWFFITLLPVCHIIPHHELLAEHYLYLPSYGYCLIAALFFTELFENKRYSPLVLSILITIIVLLSLRIIDRNRDWTNGMTLWTKTVKTVPRCARAQNNLGVEYLKEGKYKEALTHFEAALQMKPKYAEAHNNKGLVYKEQGLYDQAIGSFTNAIRFKKRYFEAVNNLALTFQYKENYNLAIKLFKNIIKRKPRPAKAYNNLGVVYQITGQLELAKEHFSIALQLDPNHIEARNNLGIWYKNKGWYDEAIEEFKQVLLLQPDLAEVRCNLGAVYNNKGWYNRAIEELKEALRLKPHFHEAMNNLGNAYRGKGEHDQALKAFRKTLEINPHLAIPHLNMALIYRYQKEDNKKALYHFERALEIEPDFPQAKSIRNEIEKLKKKELPASRDQK